MNKLFYPAVFQPEEDGGFSVFFPDIEGCNTQGDTIEESYSMAFNALGIVLSYMEDEHLPVPKAIRVIIKLGFPRLLPYIANRYLFG